MMTESWLVADPEVLGLLWSGSRARCRCHAVVDEPLTGASTRRHSRHAYCARCGRLLRIEDVELPCRD